LSSAECFRNWEKHLKKGLPGVDGFSGLPLSECKLAYKLLKGEKPDIGSKRADELVHAACYGGVSDACMIDGDVSGQSVRSVRLNCGLDKSSKTQAERTLMTWDLGREKAYCESIVEGITRKSAASVTLRMQLVRVGCVSHGNISMCRSLDKKRFRAAFLTYCSKDGLGSSSECEQLSTEFTIKEREEFCRKNSIAASCTELGQHFDRLKDHQSAFDYFEIGCVSGDKWECYSAGLQAYKMSKWADASSRLKIACDKKIYSACESLGAVYNKLGLKSDAFRMYGLACDQGSLGWSCYSAAMAAEIDSTTEIVYLEKAQRFLRSECETGNNESCNDLIRLNEYVRKYKTR
jgi:TPR repeat protein